MNTLEFTKMQGLGNDFVLVEGPRQMTSDEIARVCDRRFGVGADGLLMVTNGSPVVMDYWNADGSPAEMCGNGLRCVARYAHDRWGAPNEFLVDTPLGARSVVIEGADVEVEIGPVRIEGEETIDGERYVLVDTGNPHAVRIVEDPATVDVAAVGAKVAREAGFDAGCNVEFMRSRGDTVEMRVWERGVGETLACGTGMVAAAFVALDGQDGNISIVVPGGTGRVRIADGVAWLIGPAEYSFAGRIDQG
jgi:diaminopimelate epimerase